jgi:hypothetical protein
MDGEEFQRRIRGLMSLSFPVILEMLEIAG